MGRVVSRGIAVAAAFWMCSLLVACGSSSNNESGNRTPDNIALTPTRDVSLEIGATQAFAAIAQDRTGTALTPSPLISFVSSNNSIVTIAASGLACAGKWDSLANPQICAPGPVGTASITATSMGVSSPPVIVHVHQHIDSVAIAPLPNQTGLEFNCKLTAPFNNVAGFSKTLTFNYQAIASSGGLDITSTVGPITWQTINPNVASTSITATGLQTGQVQVTAVDPGMTQIFATIAGINSQPKDFITCPVKSISLAVTGTNDNSFTVSSGGSKTITATVMDSSDTTLTTPPSLVWSTSDAGAFSATGTATGTVTSAKAGSSTIIASCTPPLCNPGFPISLPIYPRGVINATATEPTSNTTQTNTIFVASSRCAIPDSSGNVPLIPDPDCVSVILPIATSTNTAGVGIDLPGAPDSLMFDRQGTKIYLGTDNGFLRTHGLAIVTPAADTNTAPTLLHLPTAPGKILAISPDGKKIIVSDMAETPNVVSIVDVTTATAPGITPLLITGATAADFSPDSFKAYIVAGTALYVFSPVDSQKKIDLLGPANDVSFLSNGAFAYLAGGAAAMGLTTRRTCDNTQVTGQDVSLPTSTFIKTTPDGTGMIGINSSGIDLIHVTTEPVGCAPTVTNTHDPSSDSFNFGQGSFTPTQLIVTADGRRVYILGRGLNTVILFDLEGKTTSTIQLAGGAVPIRASLTTDGKILYVAGSDNTVHVVDTVNLVDSNQITFPLRLCHRKVNTTGGGIFSCDVDLIAVKP